MKLCIGCKLELPVEDFHLTSRGRPRPRCKTCTIAQNKMWKLENSERNRELNRQYNIRHWSENKEYHQKKYREWSEQHRDRRRQSGSKHQKHLYGNAEAAYARRWAFVLKLDPCGYCGKLPSGGVDHMQPFSRGGENIVGNMIPACTSCNSRKGKRTFLEFLLRAA